MMGGAEVAASSIEAESAGKVFVFIFEEKEEEGGDLEGRRKAFVEKQKRRRNGRNCVCIEVNSILTMQYKGIKFLYLARN